MTAEIAILNKSAVALAADSAVTMTTGREEYKVYQSANKLFALSKYHPVGLNITSAIIPFAQSEMVHSFMEGVDPAYQEFMEKSIRAVLDTYGDTLLDLFKGRAGLANSDPQELSKVNEDVWNGIEKAMAAFRQQVFVDPVANYYREDIHGREQEGSKSELSVDNGGK